MGTVAALHMSMTDAQWQKVIDRRFREATENGRMQALERKLLEGRGKAADAAEYERLYEAFQRARRHTFAECAERGLARRRHRLNVLATIELMERWVSFSEGEPT